jgi:hypothetical protein
VGDERGRHPDVARASVDLDVHDGGGAGEGGLVLTTRTRSAGRPRSAASALRSGYGPSVPAHTVAAPSLTSATPHEGPTIWERAGGSGTRASLLYS